MFQAYLEVATAGRNLAKLHLGKECVKTTARGLAGLDRVSFVQCTTLKLVGT